MKTELLAWCQFPEPQGTAYTERDLCDTKKAAQLLGRAQVHRAWIAREGWQALWRIYGLEGLLKLNQRGGWFDTESDDVAAERIRHRSLIAGYDPSAEADQFGLQARMAGVMTLARDG